MDIEKLKRLESELYNAQVNYDSEAYEFIEQAKAISGRIWAAIESKLAGPKWYRTLFGQSLKNEETAYAQIKYADDIKIDITDIHIVFSFNRYWSGGGSTYYEIKFPIEFFQISSRELSYTRFIQQIFDKYSEMAKKEEQEKLNEEKAVFESLKKKFENT